MQGKSYKRRDKENYEHNPLLQSYSYLTHSIKPPNRGPLQQSYHIPSSSLNVPSSLNFPFSLNAPLNVLSSTSYIRKNRYAQSSCHSSVIESELEVRDRFNYKHLSSMH